LNKKYICRNCGTEFLAAFDEDQEYLKFSLLCPVCRKNPRKTKRKALTEKPKRKNIISEKMENMQFLGVGYFSPNKLYYKTKDNKIIRTTTSR